jgi:hypothetical protein
MMREIVRQGRWVYGEAAYQPVAVVLLDYDFWYEIGKADDRLDPDERPQLNDDGYLFYVCFASPPAASPGWVDSQGFATIEAASTWAQTQVTTEIEWFT